MKKLYIILVLILILLIPTSILKITNTDTYTYNIKPLIHWNIDKPIGTLSIKKINLKENIYDINSKENNVEKNITILKESIYPDNTNSIMIIAAHSGEGRIAYFEKLDQLKEKDEITLVYHNKEYNYIVKDIWEEKKNGYININRENKKQLVLTTCSPNKNNYQLVINCIEKEST